MCSHEGQRSEAHHVSIWAYYVLLQDPKKFYLSQMPSSFAASVFTPQAEVLTLLLGNVYLLLALLALVCI